MVRRVLLGFSCAFALTALALMLFGKGIAMRFSSGEGEYIAQRYNYLDGMVFGYGNFFAPLCAITAAVALVLLVILLWRGKYLNAVVWMFGVALFLALGAAVVFGSLTVVNLAVILLLGGGFGCVFAWRLLAGRKRER